MMSMQRLKAKCIAIVGVILISLLSSLLLSTSQLPSETEVTERVLKPSVQIAYFKGIGGATAEWRVAGSGVVFKTPNKTYILTAAHVVVSAKKVHYEIDESGKQKVIEEFDNVMAIVERVKEGIVTGELRVRCKVLKCSKVEEEGGDDVAVLEPYEGDLFTVGARPLPKDKRIYAGQPVYHCGSLLGELVNSVTFGVISSVSRMYRNKPFIQLSTTALPGSSGGGIFVVDEGKCYYAGMLTRGTGETVNLAIPITRIRSVLSKWKLEEVFDVAQ
jgi:S1-C subfamily serine protease